MCFAQAQCTDNEWVAKRTNNMDGSTATLKIPMQLWNRSLDTYEPGRRSSVLVYALTLAKLCPTDVLKYLLEWIFSCGTSQRENLSQSIVHVSIYLCEVTLAADFFSAKSCSYLDTHSSWELSSSTQYTSTFRVISPLL